MRHYEILFVSDPNFEDQIDEIQNKFESLLEEDKNLIHRKEDLKIRNFAYPIQKKKKGHFFLYNVEMNSTKVKDITDWFLINDAILRHLIIKRDTAITEASILAQPTDEEYGLHKIEINPRRPSLSETRKKCFFTKNGYTDVDYLNTKLLNFFITDSGKILGRRFTGTSRYFQKRLEVAIKRARFLSLLTYCDNHAIR